MLFDIVNDLLTHDDSNNVLLLASYVGDNDFPQAFLETYVLHSLKKHHYKTVNELLLYIDSLREYIHIPRRYFPHILKFIDIYHCYDKYTNEKYLKLIHEKYYLSKYINQYTYFYFTKKYYHKNNPEKYDYMFFSRNIMNDNHRNYYLFPNRKKEYFIMIYL